jgi:hypothetical protein
VQVGERREVVLGGRAQRVAAVQRPRQGHVAPDDVLGDVGDDAVDVAAVPGGHDLGRAGEHQPAIHGPTLLRPLRAGQ